MEIIKSNKSASTYRRTFVIISWPNRPLDVTFVRMQLMAFRSAGCGMPWTALRPAAHPQPAVVQADKPKLHQADVDRSNKLLNNDATHAHAWLNDVIIEGRDSWHGSVHGIRRLKNENITDGRTERPSAVTERTFQVRAVFWFYHKSRLDIGCVVVNPSDNIGFRVPEYCGRVRNLKHLLVIYLFKILNICFVFTKTSNRQIIHN